MAAVLKSIDVSEFPELVRLVEDIARSGEPIVLRLHGRDVAILDAVEANRERLPKREKTEEDYQAFLSAAGSWKNEDTDEFVMDLYDSRMPSSRPRPQL